MRTARFAIAASLAVALAVCALAACFAGNLFGGGAPITYPGVDPNTPIPDGTPNENASTASGLIGAHRALDAGKD